ncbi:hypothetical protein [Streptomyces sp. NPDC093099]|uniref:hypothetical protein n=1 Tax=Streptomyces sp. NPDC093099 TaxID=3366028 RepID=UPI0037F67C0F
MPNSGTEQAERAFWCERVTYSSLAVGGVADASHHVAPTPAEAISAIRGAVRDLAATLPPIERKRALSWVDGGGCIGAVGALHRGEPCGFSLSHRGFWTEWTVHPVPLPLSTRHDDGPVR